MATIISDLGATAFYLVRSAARKVVESVDIATIASDGSALNDVIIFEAAPVFSGDILRDVQIANADLDAHATPTLAFKLGLYKKNIDGTFVAVETNSDVLFVSSASTQLQAKADYTSVINVASNFDAANKAKELWEILAETADPKLQMFVGMKITAIAATPAAGAIALKVTRLVH